MYNKKPYKSKKVPLWLPYLSSFSVDSKNIGHFVYNGGEEHLHLDNISSLLIYGESEVNLPTRDLDKLMRMGIPIILHRRNLSESVIICGNGRPDPEDTLSAQLLARHNLHNKTHIARALLEAKFKSATWLVPESPTLPLHASLAVLRNIEAVHAKKYWSNFFEELGRPELCRRTEPNIYSQALDANSKFVSSIILRWITYHHMSPYHAYLHEPTSYSTLMYDLFEPYRSLFDAAFLKLWKQGNIQTKDANKFTAATIATSKELLAQKTYVPLTRQIVTNQELLHGIVLSLKFYLLKKQKRFLIPMPGKPNGGRPPHVEYMLYGRHAGVTDFWKCAHDASKNLLEVKK